MIEAAFSDKKPDFKFKILATFEKTHCDIQHSNNLGINITGQQEKKSIWRIL